MNYGAINNGCKNKTFNSSTIYPDNFRLPIVYKSLILLCCFHLASCKKESSPTWTEVEIEVKNGITSEPIDDIYFYLYGVKSNFPKSTDQIGSKYPENGELNFSFKAKRQFDYILYKQEYSSYFTQKITGGELVIGAENHYSYELVEFGQLILNVDNINCYDSHDALEYRLTYLDSDDYPISSLYWETGYTWDGCNQFTELYNYSFPAGNYNFEWKVSRDNNDNSSGEHIFFMNQNDTTYVNVEY